MPGLEMLDVLIGLVTVYLVFGIACTAVVEAISSWFNVRSNNLQAALAELFSGDLAPGEAFEQAFYAHPLVQALSKGKDGRPSYIPPHIVGRVVEALIKTERAATSLTKAVAGLPGTPETNRIKGLLSACVTQAEGKADAFRAAVEMQFNSVMDRASGWFKRYAQNVALAVAAVLVIAANVDTIALATTLANSPAARAKLVELAQQQVAEADRNLEKAGAQPRTGTPEGADPMTQAKRDTEAARQALDRAKTSLESAGLQFGWQDFPRSTSTVLAKLSGLLVSILAISLGAPFWFDVLQKFMRVRSSGTSPREKSEDKA